MIVYISRWTEKCVWGISYGGTNRHNVTPRVAPPVPSLVLSDSEDDGIQARLSDKFSLAYACGAGYKLLCVIEQLSSGYVLTKGTTFKWDSCAPHAILRAMHGGVVKLDQAVDGAKLLLAGGKTEMTQLIEECQVRYHMPDSTRLSPGAKWSNSGGIVAYQDVALLRSVIETLG